ncbi:MAG: tetratricopeptide repeat protein [bacterium]
MILLAILMIKAFEGPSEETSDAEIAGNASEAPSPTAQKGRADPSSRKANTRPNAKPSRRAADAAGDETSSAGEPAVGKRPSSELTPATDQRDDTPSSASGPSVDIAEQSLSADADGTCTTSRPVASDDASDSGQTEGKAIPKLSPDELFDQASPAVVRIVVRNRELKPIGHGSGFFISPDGLLVTNYHVIEHAHFVTVVLSNDATLFVEGIVAVDEKRDLAILKANGKALEHLDLHKSEGVKVGERVYAIGNPKGLTNTLSQGIISGFREPIEGVEVIQTTAAVSSGSSGGVLLDTHGRVVGVTSAVLAGGQNLNFAVAARRVSDLLDRATKPRTLASEGGQRLPPDDRRALVRAWKAIEAQEYYKGLRALIMLSEEYPKSPFVWFTLGYLYGELEQYAPQIDCYTKSINLKPDYASAYNNRGVAYGKHDELDKAIRDLSKAITLDGGDAVTYFNRAAVYEDQEDYAAAVDDYSQVLRLDPKNAVAYHNRGLAYAHQGDHRAAVRDYTAAIRLDPRDPVSYHTRAVSQYQLKNYARAWADVRRCENLGDHVTAEFVTALRQKAPGGEQVANRRTREKLAQRMSLDVSAVALQDVVEFLRNVTGLTIRVNWGALGRAGIDRSTPVTVRRSNVPAGEVLEAVLKHVEVSLRYTLVHGIITISTQDEIAATP